MTIAVKKKSYSFEEYLEREETASYKHEYKAGEIVPMTGGTTNHNKIIGNFYFYFRSTIKQEHYNIFTENVKLWIPRYRQGTYPDIMIINGDPIYYQKTKTTILNPSIIVEVLSSSTQNYDQGDKFLYYRSIPEFQEYILISQSQYYVMQYNKTEEGKWLLSEYEGEDNALTLGLIDFNLSFQDLYEGVVFEDENND